MSNWPLGKLVVLNLCVIYFEPNHRRSPTLLFKKPKTITVSHNQWGWERDLGRLRFPIHPFCKGKPNCLHAPPNKIFLSPPFAPGICVRMVYTLKTNRHPVATAREMDVGLDELGDGGRRRDGLERRRDRGRNVVH